MPANLNALIRYKTIDRLLGTGRKYALSELVEHCSENLGESRGIYKTISKRTIQEDIRILRSDILGFNAPIKNRFGKYYYSEANFSIFNTSISNIDILKRVYEFLLSVRDDMEDDRLDKLLIELGGLIPERKIAAIVEKEEGYIRFSLSEDAAVIEERKAPPIEKKQANAKAAPRISALKSPIKKRPIPAFGWNRVLEFVDN